MPTRAQIIYDGNGGGAPATQTASLPYRAGQPSSYKVAASLTVSSPTSAPTGKYFTNWTKTSDSYSGNQRYVPISYSPNNSTYTAGTSITFSAANGAISQYHNHDTLRQIKLKANWAWNTYSVSYSAAGGSGAPSNQTKTYNSTLYLSTTKPTRTNYTFVNWYSSADKKYYNPGGAYGYNAATTMTAQWRENTYTVSYDANGGTGAPAAQTKRATANLTLQSGKPTRSGYTFVCWKTSSGATYNPSGTYSTNASATLYAQWTENIATVTQNANGGTQGDQKQTTTPATFTTKYNNTVNLWNISSLDLTRKGYHIDPNQQWNRATDGSGTSYDEDVNYTWTTFGSLSAANTTTVLYANWKPDPHILTFNPNGGTCDETSRTRNTDQAYGTLPVATREGYTLAGWFTDATAGTQVTASTTMGAADAIVYAHWTPIVYTITYDLQGGVDTGNPTTYTIETPTFTLLEPTRQDFNFNGWTTIESSTPDSITIPQGSMGNKNFMANWTRWYTSPTLVIDSFKALRYSTFTQEAADDGTILYIAFQLNKGRNEKDHVDVLPLNYSIEIIERTSDGNPERYLLDEIEITDSFVELIIPRAKKNGATDLSDMKLDEKKVYDIYLIVNEDNGAHPNLFASTFISKAYFCIDIGPTGQAIGFGTSVGDEDKGMFVDMELTLKYNDAIKEEGRRRLVFIINEDESGTTDERIYLALQKLGWPDTMSNV